MPDLKTSKNFLKKLVLTVNHELLVPIIKRTFESAIEEEEEEEEEEEGSSDYFSDEDENIPVVNSKLIIENSLRLIYVDYLDNLMHALGPSFNEFCNFIDDIYGNRIYDELWLSNFRNYNIRLFELSYVQKTLIRQNIAIFYLIDKRIFLAGFYRRLIELQSSELLANRNFDYIRLKELEIQSHFRVVNELLPILAALSFHYFGIYKCFYLWLIAAKFSEILAAIKNFPIQNIHNVVDVFFHPMRLLRNLPIQNIHNVVDVFLLPMHLLKNNSYLILVVMHFIFGP